MIVRRYSRRGTKGFSDSGFDGVGSGSLSQESPPDVYDFAYSSQGSTYWSAEHQGLSSNPSSQEINDRQDDVLEDLDGVFWKSSKKVKIEEDQFNFDSSLESDELVIFPSGMSEKQGKIGYSNIHSKNLRKAEPFLLNSSQESNNSSLLPPGSGKENKKIDGFFKKTKKSNENGVPKKNKKKTTIKNRVTGFGSVPVALTTTLMETQESGEMIEHEDELNFALDGLRKGQPVRIRRGSLLSLLSLCATAQQRRMLRAHGRAGTVLDAVLGLSLDDSLSNLAAVAVFYVLTNDGEDDCLLDSPSRIRFLMKLLKPLTPDTVKAKSSSLGSKLLSIRRHADTSQDLTNGSDSSNSEIIQKVEELLISCKDLKPRYRHDIQIEKPELTSKWVCLLCMEKACLSIVSIEDTSGRMQKSGGNFKEKLRELGGLNAVFEIARTCHCIMEGLLGRDSSSFLESKDVVAHENLVLLLKCMQIMENATFLSEENQSHLLGMKGNLDSKHAPRSFIKLILSVIQILSSLSVLWSNSSMSQTDTSNGHSWETSCASDSKDDVPISSSLTCCTVEGISSKKCSNMYEDNQGLTTGPSISSRFNSEEIFDPSLKMRIESSSFVSCSAASRNRNYGKKASDIRTQLDSAGSTKCEAMPDSGEDPFAFDAEDVEPSKWDLRRQKASQKQNSRAKVGHCENGSEPSVQLGKDKLHKESHHTDGVLCDSSVVEEMSSLISDCLLASVKVFMNLTNDNPVGCQQIAACGGLETLSTLIAVHFPSFRLYLPHLTHPGESGLSPRRNIVINRQNEKPLTDQQLDLLVAILGLLVNLVEKDGKNRSRLATARVSLDNSDIITDEENRVDLILLLCSIFLANQGAGEAAGEAGHVVSLDDEEDVVSQGEKEAEKMIVEAYAALLLAFLSTESRSIRNSIADCLPDHNLAILVPVLERFLEFHLALDMISSETHSTVLEVIESCRIP